MINGTQAGPSSFLVNQFQLVYSGLMKRWYATVLLALSLVALLSCGAAEEFGAARSEMAMEAAAPAAQMAVDTTGTEAMAMARETEAPPAMPMSESAESSASSDQLEFLPSLNEVQESVSAQQRIIVRTVGMGLVVDNVADRVDQVANVAQELGGWTVSSDRSAIHRGSVSVRVPAQQLDEAVRRIRSLAIHVESESSNSQDVTDEYVDTNSRLRSLRATEESLLELMASATKVEDALEVQRELTELQAQIESHEGRIKFLEQTAAFSLINVELTLAPKPMGVNAGPDRTFSTGQVARFRATFSPPPGIEDYSFTWDFGDGAQASGSGTAPTTEPGQRVTATVNHVFEDDNDSPYIVQLEMTGTGPSGIVEGTDALIATVTKIPTIEVFAGESRVVEEGDENEYTASFTRSDSVWDIQYRWDFGDGSPTVIGTPEEGATKTTVEHTYENYRPQPYEVSFTVTAQSAAGEVKGGGSFSVSVTESEGLVIGNWDLGGTAKSAVRALSGIALALVNVFIWLAIFSPVWIGIAAVGYVIYRGNRFLQARRERQLQILGRHINTVAQPPEETEPPQEPEQPRTQ